MLKVGRGEHQQASLTGKLLKIEQLKVVVFQLLWTLAC